MMGLLKKRKEKERARGEHYMLRRNNSKVHNTKVHNRQVKLLK